MHLFKSIEAKVKVKQLGRQWPEPSLSLQRAKSSASSSAKSSICVRKEIVEAKGNQRTLRISEKGQKQCTLCTVKKLKS